MTILPIVFILDLLIPFILAPAYKGYNHLIQVMSVLGNSKARYILYTMRGCSLWNYLNSDWFQRICDYFREFQTDCSNTFCNIVDLCNRRVYSFWFIPCWGSKKSCYSFRKNTWVWFCYWFYVLSICTTFSRNLCI